MLAGAADNASGFNCRPVKGMTRWSRHAYGLAVDVNPIENPYVGVDGGLDRRASRPYVWGGTWTGCQHFSATGH